MIKVFGQRGQQNSEALAQMNHVNGKGSGNVARQSLLNRCLHLLGKTIAVVVILLLAFIALALGPRLYYEIVGTKNMKGRGITFNAQVNEITFSLHLEPDPDTMGTMGTIGNSDGGEDVGVGVGVGVGGQPMRREKEKEKEKGVWVEQMSSHPRAFVLHNLLTDDECEHMIQIVKDRLERSAVIGNNTKSAAEGVKDSVRTSHGALIWNYHDDTITAIGEKVGIWAGIPIGNHEHIQVLRYEEAQLYKPHYDLLPEDRIRGSVFSGGQRTATILLYLSDVEEGGETHFPMGTLTSEYSARHTGEVGTLSECGKEGFGAGFKPKKGSALLFHSTDATTMLSDMYSLHQGCPVLKGTKWTATIWMHQHTHNFLIFDTS